MKSRFALLMVGLTAVTCVSAMSASAASASGHFHFESSPTYIKGVQGTKNVLTLTGGTIKCTGAEFISGGIAGTSAETISVQPDYTGCTGFGQKVNVDMTGCNFLMSAGSGSVGSFGISCETGKEIVLTWSVAGCTVRIPSQTPGNDRLGYSNEGVGALRGILVTSQVEGIRYASSGGLCGASGTNGTLTGTSIVRAYGNQILESQHGIWME